MRALAYILSVGTALLAGCGSSSPNVTIDPLSFYVVSEGKIEDGRFIDTPDFPKLGYISAAPDLVVTRLQAVVPDISREQSVMVDGKRTVEPLRERAAFHIRMHAAEARKFTALTEQAVGKRLLVMLGDSPLTAPRVMSPISTESLFMTFGENADTNKIEHALKRLIR
jgi:hypothetical protein